MTPTTANRCLRQGILLNTCRQHRGASFVTEATYYRWRNQFGGLKAEDAKKLKHLEKQNLQLKKLLAEAELEKAVLKELAEGNF